MAYIADTAKCFEAFPDQTAPCLPPHPTPLASYWTHGYDTELTRRNSEGALPREADFVILGSGLTGVHAAAQLVDRLLEEGQGEHARGNDKLSIVVLEARDFCSGATGRNGGHLTALPRIQFAAIEELYGREGALRSTELEDRAVKLVLETCAAEGWEEEVDLVQGGNITLFDDEASAEAVQHQLRAAENAGVDVSSMEWLNSSELIEEVGAEAHSGLRIPSHNLYPLRYVTALFRRALARIKASECKTRPSLDLYTHTVVSSVDSSASKSTHQWEVQTSRGPILARSVLHCTNGYASSIVPSLAEGPARVVPTRGQVLAYAPSPASNPRWTSAFSSPHAKEYFFQRPHGGPVILGGARIEAGPPFEFGVSDDSVVNASVERNLKRYLPSQFPKWFAGEREGEVERSWTGVMGYRMCGVPLVGKLFVDGAALQGQYISAGYSGHGVVRAPMCGQVIADQALAELRGETYELPEWMPRHFISKAEGGKEKGVLPEMEAGKSSSWCVVG